MNFNFVQATKEQAKARIALIGASGSGKTYSALSIAQGLGKNIAVIDTENGSASKYAGKFNFQTLNLKQHSPAIYVQAIEAAQKAGFDVLIIDSLSHAWAGRGGALEMVDDAAKRSKSGNSFTAWRDVTPHHNRLVDALINCSCHLIVTMRAKTEYVIEENAKGQKVPRKIGLAPVQRDGLDYEFDIVADVDLDHNMMITKTRCEELDGKVFHKPGANVADVIASWLSDGDVPEPKVDFEAVAEVEGGQADEPFDDPATGATANKTVNTKSKLYKRMHVLGTQIYGNAWDDERKTLVRRGTNGQSESSQDLTIDQVTRFITYLENKLQAEIVAA